MASSGRNTAQAWAVFSKQPLCHSPCKPETEHITAPAGMLAKQGVTPR